MGHLINRSFAKLKFLLVNISYFQTTVEISTVSSLIFTAYKIGENSYVQGIKSLSPNLHIS